MTDRVPDEALGKSYPILAFFGFEHLPRRQKETSRPFHSLAWAMARNLPSCAETSAGLRKLLEAKDCAVRASLGAQDD